ncbi:MAG TPA: hypothetical protein VNO23_01735 [Candidatus Binatia bacterium]|nr:hypothetical protein [Candidatus Binatia bacterium]
MGQPPHQHGHLAGGAGALDPQAVGAVQLHHAQVDVGRDFLLAEEAAAPQGGEVQEAEVSITSTRSTGCG